ncbi:xanthine dehydrogenase family protein molybdopterin-binding subunit [Rhizobium leguminosarum]|uniref:xanthine dehydrogenase family protein molybdopterin-binding subunit n=1 Tax=Rhizobium leguminosarum TaxID=384 RepID=UPI001C956757|nr:xanthine dehydrogenase family protein molybdopterin-binding subunit [Rhizobium leguminosarum]MBY5460829.1 xanthine dehydrogenase family protein molybdopterin-binding subunit [Rhizobium leguminosarum]
MNEAAPPPKENMGAPLPRVDARLKVMGKASYPADIPVNNLAHGLLVTSVIARGRIKTLHLEQARAVPGVIDIMTHEDVRGELEPPEFGTSGSTSIGPLHDTKIWHDGQIIALVIAETIEAAREAAMRIAADCEEEKPSTSFGSEGTETAAGDASEQFKEDVKVGDFNAAFASAEVKIDAEYLMPAHHHNPIELFSTTAYWQGDELTVHEPSQNVWGWRAEIARQLKIAPERVRVVSPYIGGAFGSKGPITPRTAIVALAARKLGRPVRCVVTRSQAFTTQTYRAETRHHIQIGATRDGKITSLKHEGWEVTSRPDPYVVGGTTTTGRMYDYGSVLTKVSLVKTDRPTPSYMRSPPETPYVYALENAMDEMAVALDMDPVEFRRINDAMKEPIEGRPFSSRSLMECYDQAAQAFGWSRRKPGVGDMRDGDWLIGMGCATAIYPTNIAPCAVRITLTDDGHARVQTASHEIGTGVRTIAAQLTAEQLGLDPRAVEVEMGDTRLPPAPVAGGSNTTASVSSAIIKACGEIRDKLIDAAVTGDSGPLTGRNPAAVTFQDGKLVTAAESQDLKDVFKHLGSGVIEQYTEFRPDAASPEAVSNLYKGKMEMVSGEKGEKVKYAFGAEFVEVRIHRRTREIRVPRIVGAFAGGRIMNTRTARSQLMGGMIWGISSALHEATEFDRRNARVVNRDLQDYLVPVNADIEDVEVILIPEVDKDVNPAGVKGLGELGNVGTAAAIASAVYHATGKRIRELPIRIDSLI